MIHALIVSGGWSGWPPFPFPDATGDSLLRSFSSLQGKARGVTGKGIIQTRDSSHMIPIGSWELGLQ